MIFCCFRLKNLIILHVFNLGRRPESSDDERKVELTGGVNFQVGNLLNIFQVRILDVHYIFEKTLQICFKLERGYLKMSSCKNGKF